MQFQNHYLTLIHVTVTRVKKTWDDFRARGTKQDVPASQSMSEPVGSFR